MKRKILNFKKGILLTLVTLFSLGTFAQHITVRGNITERTRELNGEWNRWEELSRAGLLVKRAKTFNAQAAPNIADRHVLRPIPQTFIDGLTQENGSPLTEEQKASFQNPGW